MAETDRQGTDPATDLASDAAGLQVGSQTDATAGSNAAAAAEDKPLPALFLDTMPDNEEEHPDLAAMNTMMGELTADEKAENGRVTARQPRQPACSAIGVKRPIL